MALTLSTASFIRYINQHYTKENMEPKYAITVELTGHDGNAMSIMSNVGRALMRNGVPKEEVDIFYAEAMSSDYDHLLRTAARWVEVA